MYIAYSEAAVYCSALVSIYTVLLTVIDAVSIWNQEINRSTFSTDAKRFQALLDDSRHSAIFRLFYIP